MNVKAPGQGGEVAPRVTETASPGSLSGEQEFRKAEVRTQQLLAADLMTEFHPHIAGRGAGSCLLPSGLLNKYNFSKIET